jgi:solute carrier family 50 protein (sugar transporter)
VQQGNIELFSHMSESLAVQGVVIRTECLEFMPFYLSLSTLLMSSSFAVYGFLLRDFYIYVSARFHFSLHLFESMYLSFF